MSAACGDGGGDHHDSGGKRTAEKAQLMDTVGSPRTKDCRLDDSAMADDSKKTVIGTHNGKFHCDEALACYMLRLLPEYSHAHIVRTRDSDKLKECDIVVDVGGVYDPKSHRYDHHQRSFSGSMNSLTDGVKHWTTKLSSAGLVYLHFGRRVIATITDGEPDSAETEDLYDMTYTHFVEEIDAVDNGIHDRDGVPRYHVSSTISARVGRLNPAWNSESQDNDGLFLDAMKLVGSEFRQCILDQLKISLPAKNVVKTCLDNRFEVHSSGEVMLLDPPCPWTQHLFELESQLSISPVIKFVIFPEGAGSTRWRVQAVPTHPGSFQNRLPLLEEWRGLRDEELSRVADIDGCVFVHASGFIGGNATREGVLAMALKTLTAANSRL